MPSREPQPPISATIKPTRWGWMPFALGLLGLSALVIALTVRMIAIERERRAEFTQATAHALVRLSAARVEQLIADAAGPHARFRRAQVVHDRDGEWWLELSHDSGGDGRGPARRLQVSALRAPLAQAALGPEGAATVRTEQLQLVQRYRNGPDTPVPYGSTAVSSELRQLIAEQPLAGSYRAVTTIDQVARINAFQRVGNAPLYVIVGIPDHDGAAMHNRLELPLLLTAALTLLLATLATVWIYRLSLQRMDAAQRRYRSIVEFSEDAIISKNIDGTITSWNRAAERIFGWTAQDIIGQPILTLIPPELHAEEADIIRRLRQGQRIEGLETERLTRDGRRIPVAVTISPLRDPNGRISGASKIARDISRQKQLEAEVRAQAMHDALTGLPNRRLLADRLSQAQQHSQRSGQWAALLFLDLDRFKQLNDRLGHDAGDECLRQVAARLRAALRDADTVARLGGDEFILLCPELGHDRAQAQETAQGFAQRAAQVIGEPMPLSQGEARIGASIGMVLFRGNAESADRLLREADQAMFAIKQQRPRDNPDATT